MVAGKWKARLLLLLSYGPHSFSELRRALPGIRQQVLSAQLTALVEHGIADRERQIGPAGPSSLYSLTALGESLMPVLETVEAWGIAHLQSRGIHWTRHAAEKKLSGQRTKRTRANNLHPSNRMPAER
jgi:DNA-binding HxlR family transcriptional regulator